MYAGKAELRIAYITKVSYLLNGCDQRGTGSVRLMNLCNHINKDFTFCWTIELRRKVYHWYFDNPKYKRRHKVATVRKEIIWITDFFGSGKFMEIKFLTD